MLIIRFMILFWVTTRVGLHALMLKKQHIVFFPFCPVVQLSYFNAQIPSLL